MLIFALYERDKGRLVTVKESWSELVESLSQEVNDIDYRIMVSTKKVPIELDSFDDTDTMKSIILANLDEILDDLSNV